MGEDTHRGSQLSAGHGNDGTHGPERPYGRRALMLGAAAAGAGITAGLVAGAGPAQAAALQGTPVLLGDTNNATAATSVVNNSGVGFVGQTNVDNFNLYGVGGVATGSAVGVFGSSQTGTGVFGATEGNGQSAVAGYETSPTGGHGVYGSSSVGAGVYGVGGGYGVYGAAGVYGVYGAGGSATGVYGQTSGNGQAGVQGVDESTGGGYGVYGSSPAGTGIYGVTAGNSQVGVEGGDVSSGGGTGVFGNSEHGTGVFGESGAGNGVGGQTSGNGKVAVLGTDVSAGGATGVKGVSVKGTGVSAVSTTGAALDVAGVAKFSRSGLATVAGTTTTPKTSVKVTGVTLTASSMILATLQAYQTGIGIAAAVPNVAGKSFTIYLTAPVKASVKVAWFIIG